MGDNQLVSFNIDGKPLEKLIEVVSKGIGVLYRPRSIRKDAEAQAYSIKVLSKARAEAEAEARLIEYKSLSRIENRIIAKEIRRQNNIDKVVEMAADNLVGKDVSDKPVEEDWANKFFDIVQDVSKEDMQVLWSKILSGEIERPSSFSLRTLDLVRNLSSEEASLFVKISDFVIEQDDFFVFNDSDVLSRLGVNYSNIAKMIEVGLLQPGDFVQRLFHPNPERDSQHCFAYSNHFIMLTIPKSSKEIGIPITLLTKAGQELFSLVQPHFNEEYLKSFAAYIKSKNNNVSLGYSKIISREGNSIRYTTPLKVL